MRFIFTIIFLLFATPTIAQDFTPPYGLAMHGAAKYNVDSAHLTYANPQTPKGGTLKMAAIGTFDTVNPYTIKGKSAQGLNLVYDRLMARVWDEPFTMYPLIAERVDVAENRSSITFHLNPKAQFHDGAKITTADVKYSFETLRDFGRPNMRRIYKLVNDITVKNERTITFTLGEGYDEETVMIIAMMPVLSKTFWETRSFDSTTLDDLDLNGPYRIKEIDAGRRIVYERVKDYWANDLLANVGHHNFDQIIYDYYRDDTVAFEAFKSGDSDLRREFDAGQWASNYDFPSLKNGDVIAENIPHSRPERARGLIFNTRRAPFDDLRVRRAFNLLFDFEWVNKNLYHDRFKRITSYYPNSELAHAGLPSAAELEVLEPWKNNLDPSIFGNAYTPTTNKTPQDIRANMRAADSLLKESGWRIENGKRIKNGKPLSFEIALEAPEDEKIALHFKRALDKMGIDVRIRVLDTAAYRGRLNEYDFDMTVYHVLSSLSPGTEQVLYWGCEAAKQPARWNFSGICNPAIDKIASAIAMAKTRDGLVAHVRALDRILMHGYYMIPLYYVGEDYVAHNADIKRPSETPLYGMVQETWWMDQGDTPDNR